jgi:hypothetical protein
MTQSVQMDFYLRHSIQTGYVPLDLLSNGYWVYLSLSHSFLQHPLQTKPESCNPQHNNVHMSEMTDWTTGRMRFDPRQRRKNLSSSLCVQTGPGTLSLLSNGYRGSLHRDYSAAGARR